MNLKEMGVVYITNDRIPECVLNEPLDPYMLKLYEYKCVFFAMRFDSGPPNNPSARSYVFYFYRGEFNEHQRPDDIITFKVKFADTSKIHIIDQYLGGVAYGPINAPSWSERDVWRPGWMSQEGRQQMKEIADGRFQAASPMTVISHRFPDSPSEKSEPEKTNTEANNGMGIGMKVFLGLLVVVVLYYAC
ncbi:MAG: hypothetical protein HYV66_01080 [Candidatus Sungbacteria bacterium]|uniref:Uncharacterized protein n=1 Tax=Candidatus Sungiibacteriota bacterium TaxID=2750080 RepID=A0A931YDD5_9BACT|nr:hypothetical protein [Candidatus Sungbacteria bacterium]